MFDRFLRLPGWQRYILAIGCAGLLVHMTISMARVGNKIGDYDINREFGRRFLAGEPLYQGGQCFNYMPVSALYWAPLALVPPRIGMALRYFTALVCLVIALRILSVMSRDDNQRVANNDMERDSARSLTVTLATLILGIHYLSRDFDDGGPHVILLAILLGGIYCIWQGRDLLGASLLGLGIAVKITPGLFLPWLIWKRRWRLAAYTAAATFFWILLPAIWMGPLSWWQHQRQWNTVALSVLGDSDDVGRDSNEQRVQNQALKPALMRYLVTYPPGHDLRLEHAAYIDFLNLSPETASRAANAVLLLLGACFCLRTGRTWHESNSRIVLGETAALLLLVLLFSPVTWLQHFVFALPAIFWIVAEQRRAPRGVTGVAIGLFALLALFMNREFLGRQNYLLLLSYHTHTFCLLLLFAMVLAGLSSRARATNERNVPEILAPKRRAA